MKRKVMFFTKIYVETFNIYSNKCVSCVFTCYANNVFVLKTGNGRKTSALLRLLHV